MIYYKSELTILLFTIIVGACTPDINYLPDTLYGLSLKKNLSGKEAENFVNRLHFEKVTDSENQIGFYSGKLGKAVLYLTIYSNKDRAVEDERRMCQKISPGNSVFSPVMYKTVEGKAIGYTYGMGQIHYIFCHENVLFWISVDKQYSEDFLQYYFEYVLKI